MVYRDAQKGDSAAKKMYKELVGMHECFERLSKAIAESGEILSMVWSPTPRHGWALTLPLCQTNCASLKPKILYIIWAYEGLRPRSASTEFVVAADTDADYAAAPFIFQVRDIEIKIEQESNRASVLNLEAVRKDFADISMENEALRQRVGA